MFKITGEQIAAARKAKGWTQAKLAEKINAAWLLSYQIRSLLQTAKKIR